MMNTVLIRGISAVLLSLAAATALATDDKVREAPGFYGSVLVGAGYIDIESNLIKGNKLIDVGEDIIQSVNQSPKSNSDGYPMITGEVNYAFGDRMEVFFGSNIEDLVTLDMSQRLGIRKQWEGVGVVGVSLLWSGIPGEVWEDPYLAGAPRTDTDRDSSGFQFDWRRILDSNFFLQVRTRKIDIDDERSGTDPALGLTPDQILLLRRDGDDSRVTLGYRWENGPHLLQPEVTIGQDDRDGDAVSADTSAAKLTYAYNGDRWLAVGTVQYFNSDADQANPIYGRKTDSDGYAVGATLSRKLDMGDGNWVAFGAVSYADSDSDVDFHDATVFGVNVGLGYNFGRK